MAGGRRTERARFVLLVALVAMVAACSAPAPTASAPASASGPTVAPRTASAAAPTPTAASASPLRSAAPGVTPSPAPPTLGNTPDSVLALATVRTYVGHLVAGRYGRAWQLLSAQSQQQSGSLSAFTAERSAFFASAGKRFRIGAPDNSAAMLARWLPNAFDGQPERAFAITVKYPQLPDNNAGFEVFVVAPDHTGTWKIWVVR